MWWFVSHQGLPNLRIWAEFIFWLLPRCFENVWFLGTSALKAHFCHVTFLVTVRRKMTTTNNRMYRQRFEIRCFHLDKFYPLSSQICIFWKFVHGMPSLFALLQKQTTQGFTIVKKLIYSPQSQVHKSVFHKVVMGELPPVMSLEILHNSRSQMFRIWNSFYKVKMGLGEKQNNTYGISFVCTYMAKNLRFFGLHAL